MTDLLLLGVLLVQFLLWRGLRNQNQKLNKIMATQAEAAAELQRANASLTKISAETSTLLEKVAALEAAAANAGNVGPELQAAIDGVVSQAQAVDDLVPDQPA